MNFKKYTKAELISKIKSSQEQLDNKLNKLDKLNKIGTEYSIIIQINSYFSQIWDLISTFKNLLVKLTLISFFIQLFKKYKIFKRLWKLLNTIVMSIFSLSLIDNLGFEFIKDFLTEFKSVFTNIIDYLTNTQFYEYLTNLYSTKEEQTTSEKSSKSRSMISTEDKRESSGNGNEVR
jgi:hypothetical protein